MLLKVIIICAVAVILTFLSLLLHKLLKRILVPNDLDFRFDRIFIWSIGIIICILIMLWRELNI